MATSKPETASAALKQRMHFRPDPESWDWPHNVSLLPRRTKHAWLCSSFQENHVTETTPETQEQPGFTPLQPKWGFVRGPLSQTHTPFISLCSPTGAVLWVRQRNSQQVSHSPFPISRVLLKRKIRQQLLTYMRAFLPGELCEAGTGRGVILHWWSSAGNNPTCGYSPTPTIPPPFPFFLTEMACVVLYVCVCTKVCFFFTFW